MSEPASTSAHGGPSGVRGRIVRSTVAVTVVAMLLMILAVLIVVTQLTRGRIDASLRDRLAAAEAASTRQPDGSLKVTNAGANDIIDSVWIFDRDGTEVTGPEAGTSIRATILGLSGVTRTTRLERRDHVYIAQPIRLPGESRIAGVAVAEESTRPYDGEKTDLLIGLAVLGVLISVVTARLTAWTVRRTLRPVQQMTELASVWSDTELDSRFDLGPGLDEFSSLGRTLDSLLDKVAHSIRSEQQLTAELAHELRTPLTTIRVEAELGLLARVDEPTRQRLDRIVQQVDRLTGIITTLLAIARHQNSPESVAELAPLLRDLAQTAAGASSVEIVVTGLEKGPVQVRVGSDLVERIIAPVLDNALRYATHRVTIEVGRDGADVTVRVCDDGPGIDPGDAEDIFQAGVGDPDGPGAGLGLPLARRVAAGVGGSVQVISAASPTILEIRLPAAPGSPGRGGRGDARDARPARTAAFDLRAGPP